MMQRQDHHHHNHNHNQGQEQSRVFYELSSLILNILRSPPTAEIHFSGVSPATNSTLPPSPPPQRRRRLPQQITPAGFASLMLGISLTLMLCGSVTFFIGFMLLPWVIGFFMVFYFVGLVTSLSVLGRAVLFYATSPPPSSPSSPRKDIPAWKFM